MFVLAVKIHEPRSLLANGRGSGQRAVQGCAAPAALCRDFPSDDELAALWVLEDRLDRGVFLARADQVCRGAPAREKPKGTHNDGLPCTGFTGQDVEAGLELQLEPLDHSKIPNRQKAEHRARSS